MPVMEFALEYQANLRLVFARRATAGLQASPFLQQSVSQLLAQFLKLNIQDPNNDPATHEALRSAMERARAAAVEIAREKQEAAEDAKEQAQAAQSDPVGAVIAFLVSLWPWP